MRRILSTLVALALNTQASASNATAEPSPARDAHRAEGDESTAMAGYRISASNEFLLIEHGHRRPRSQPTAAGFQAKLGETTALHAPKHALAKKTLASNFRRAAYLPHVYAAEAKFGLPSGLLDALIWTESRYDPLAVSKAGAAGLGQLMPGTAHDLGVSNRFDPYSNILGAGRYLRQMLDRFGVVHLAVAAYNAGPGAVGRRQRIPRNGETPSYVLKVLARWKSS